MLRVPFHPQDFFLLDQTVQEETSRGGAPSFFPISFLFDCLFFETKEGEKFDDRVQL